MFSFCEKIKSFIYKNIKCFFHLVRKNKSFSYHKNIKGFYFIKISKVYYIIKTSKVFHVIKN